MKLYQLDCGYRGTLICIANSKKEAMEIFDNNDNDIHNAGDDRIVEYEITHGTFIACWGDC